MMYNTTHLAQGATMSVRRLLRAISQNKVKCALISGAMVMLGTFCALPGRNNALRRRLPTTTCVLCSKSEKYDAGWRIRKQRPDTYGKCYHKYHATWAQGLGQEVCGSCKSQGWKSEKVCKLCYLFESLVACPPLQGGKFAYELVSNSQWRTIFEQKEEFKWAEAYEFARQYRTLPSTQDAEAAKNIIAAWFRGMADELTVARKTKLVREDSGRPPSPRIMSLLRTDSLPSEAKPSLCHDDTGDWRFNNSGRGRYSRLDYDPAADRASTALFSRGIDGRGNPVDRDDMDYQTWY